jgi:hypothetical protein
LCALGASFSTSATAGNTVSHSFSFASCSTPQPLKFVNQSEALSHQELAPQCYGCLWERDRERAYIFSRRRVGNKALGRPSDEWRKESKICPRKSSATKLAIAPRIPELLIHHSLLLWQHQLCHAWSRPQSLVFHASSPTLSQSLPSAPELQPRALFYSAPHDAQFSNSSSTSLSVGSPDLCLTQSAISICDSLSLSH